MNIFPLDFWNNFSILVDFSPKSALNLICAFISNRSCHVILALKVRCITKRTRYLLQSPMPDLCEILTYAVSKNFGKFHDVQLTYELFTANWTECKYNLFRTGANMRCYGYKCDSFIKVKIRIIPELHKWIDNDLFFENMPISVIFHKI